MIERRPLTMKPAQLLDVQAELMERSRDRLFREMIGTTMAPRMGSSQKQAEQLVYPLHNALATAEAFYVTQDLAAEAMRRVSVDGGDYPGTRAFDRNDAPTGTGIVFIEGGLRQMEIRGREERIHLLVWGPAIALDPDSNEKLPVTLMWGFCDVLQPDEVLMEMTPALRTAILKNVGRWNFAHAQTMFEQQRIGPPHVRPSELDLEQSRRFEQDEQLKGRPMPPLPDEPYWDNPIRPLIALWDLFNESVSVVSHGRAYIDRATVRRARRANIPGRVTVIKLRRAKYVDHDYLGPTAVDWQHRWIVRRHRRWQACGPGRKERKLIWIEAYEKGPKDKPLAATEQVYRLDR